MPGHGDLSGNAGIEELVSQDITVLPNGAAAIPVMDRQLFITKNWDEYPVRHYISHGFPGARAVATTPAAPGMIVFAGKEDRNYTMDAGETWIPFPEGAVGADVKFGRVAISCGNPDNFLAFINADSGSFRVTPDRGRTWTRAEAPELARIPMNNRGKPLVADGADPGTFYFAQTGKGIQRSTDQGLTWQLLRQKEWPRGMWSLVLKSLPGRSGELLLPGEDWDKPPIGLWRSRDHGVTWEKDPQVTQAIMACAGVPVPGSEYPTLYVQGRVGDDFGIWRSIDDGKSWQKIGTHPRGIYHMSEQMAGDWDVFGRVTLGLRGNGFVYGMPKQAQPGPAE